jgi:hypothetical protein
LHGKLTSGYYTKNFDEIRMRMRRVILGIGGSFALLGGLIFGFYHFILDWEGRPYCHKQIMFAFFHWMDDQGMPMNSDTNAFPNISGKSAASLAPISKLIGNPVDWAARYNYVPGLRQDDPGELVLMYIDQPTRWSWHGSPPTIFKEKEWIILAVDFGGPMREKSGPGELSERVSREEFCRRLKATLDFVRTNERPYWRTVVDEHTEFLKSIDANQKWR